MSDQTPNWNNAPQWAQYWAVDPDGIAHWFSAMPFVTFDLMENETFIAGWFHKEGADSEQCGYYTNVPDWTKTLQQRPTTNTLPENGPKEPEYFKVTKGRNYLTGWPDTGF